MLKLFGTMSINNEGVLTIGKKTANDLVKEFGSPLYVIDEAFLRDKCRVFEESFKSDMFDTEVVYASKAFLNMSMARLINEEGLSMDVVSGGEIYTAIKAGFPMERLYFHGNNKTLEELNLAIENNLGTIVLDHIQEIEILEEILKEKGKTQDVLLRVNPGIEAHTHEYIQTTNHDSKFGESIYAENIYDIVKKLSESEQYNFKGFHCHIGSQIFERSSFVQAALAMIDFVKEIEDKTGVKSTVLNLGGGFGVYYTEEDQPMELSNFLKSLVTSIEEKITELKLTPMKLLIEPGRSIICNAGSTLYTVGGVKETYGRKNYIFVDGGMTDNPRPALYQAKYEASIANKMTHPYNKKYTVAGKCCESGDVIIRDMTFPDPEIGDILVVASTGAYNYSMSSNYNRVLKPAVVFVKDGEGKVAVKRETYDDIIRNDV